jgi:hypothetical protein
MWVASSTENPSHEDQEVFAEAACLRKECNNKEICSNFTS